MEGQNFWCCKGMIALVDFSLCLRAYRFAWIFVPKRSIGWFVRVPSDLCAVFTVRLMKIFFFDFVSCAFDHSSDPFRVPSHRMFPKNTTNAVDSTSFSLNSDDLFLSSYQNEESESNSSESSSFRCVFDSNSSSESQGVRKKSNKPIRPIIVSFCSFE